MAENDADGTPMDTSISAAPSSALAVPVDANITEVVQVAAAAAPIDSATAALSSSSKPDHDYCLEGDAADRSFDEGTTCSICFEDYTNSGLHRLVSISCGHLFGKKCIEKWVRVNKTKTPANPKCPKCKEKFSVNDIRLIYARGIRVLDTSEKDHALRELERVKKEKCQLEMQLALERLRAEQTDGKLRAMETKKASTSSFGRELDSEVFETGLTQSSGPHRLSSSLAFVADICPLNFSRVQTASPEFSVVLASFKNNNNLWPGFGLKKVDLETGVVNGFIPLHTGQIRDVKMDSTGEGLLVSASMDKSLRVSSLRTNSVVHKVETGSPAWSACWRTGSEWEFVAGLSNGQVHLYDTRMLGDGRTGLVQELASTDACGPVTSLHWLSDACINDASSIGVLAGRLKESYFYQSVDGFRFRPHKLGLQGPMSSMSFDPSSKHFLVTFRPSTEHKRLVVTHELYNLYTGWSGDSRSFGCRRVQQMLGGRTQELLTRNVLFMDPFSGHSCLCGLFNESQSSVDIFDASTARPKHSLPPSPKVMQLDFVSFQNKQFFTVLQSGKLTVFDLFTDN